MGTTKGVHVLTFQINRQKYLRSRSKSMKKYHSPEVGRTNPSEHSADQFNAKIMQFWRGFIRIQYLRPGSHKNDSCVLCRYHVITSQKRRKKSGSEKKIVCSNMPAIEFHRNPFL